MKRLLALGAIGIALGAVGCSSEEEGSAAAHDSIKEARLACEGRGLRSVHLSLSGKLETFECR